MSMTHRITRKPALFRSGSRRHAGALAALFALAAQAALAQASGEAVRDAISPGADPAAPPLISAAKARPADTRPQPRGERGRRPIGWAVALALVALALRREEGAESARGA